MKQSDICAMSRSPRSVVLVDGSYFLILILPLFFFFFIIIIIITRTLSSSFPHFLVITKHPPPLRLLRPVEEAEGGNTKIKYEVT